VASLSGAHAAHAIAGPIGPALPCSECHQLPTDATHETAPVTVTFGPLATTGGLTPTWTKATATCGNVYCHGAALTGGAETSPQWDAGVSAAQCGSCHGASPVTNGHVATGVNYCSVCHAGVSSSGVITLAAGTHVNGVMNVAALVDRKHPAAWLPPGHTTNIDFSTCTVCHATGRTCSSCH
jgi:predicted CxxxxCH...CXXCH cytochrome family protein